MVSYPETSIDHQVLLLQVASTQNITSLTSSFVFVLIYSFAIRLQLQKDAKKKCRKKMRGGQRKL